MGRVGRFIPTPPFVAAVVVRWYQHVCLYVCLQAQHHPWLNNHDPSGKEQKLSEAALANLVAFRKTNVLKKLALELVARSLDHEQIRNLEKDFAKVGRWVGGVFMYVVYRPRTTGTTVEPDFAKGGREYLWEQLLVFFFVYTTIRYIYNSSWECC